VAEMPHMRRREGDEYFCPRCSKRWAVDDEEPGPCVEDVRRPMLRDHRDEEAVAYLRDVDGTGSYHVCAWSDAGAFPVYR